MSVDANALERETLERKDRDELQKIAGALGGKVTSRTRKADIIDMILELTGVTSRSSDDAADDAAEKDDAEKDDAAAEADDDSDDGSSEDEATDDDANAADAAPSADRKEQSGGRGQGVSAQRARQQSSQGGGNQGSNQGGGNQGKAQNQPNKAQNQDQQAKPQNQQDGQNQANADDDGEGSKRRRRRGRNRDQGNQDEFTGEPIPVAGLLDLRDDGYGFLRVDSLLPSKDDCYVSVKQVRQFGLRKGDVIAGGSRPAFRNEKNPALVRIDTVNDAPAESEPERPTFEELPAVFADDQLVLTLTDEPTGIVARALDLLAPIGKGSRVLLASPPRAGKTTILETIARSVETNEPECPLLVVLLDERPEEIAEMERFVAGGLVYGSAFDADPQDHISILDLVIARARRLAEGGDDVVLLIDGLTRLARAEHSTGQGSNRTFGGLDTGAVTAAKRAFGAGRNLDGAGSVTVVATAAVDTGSDIDAAVYEAVAGAATTEIHLDAAAAARRSFPAIDIARSGTRHEELLVGDEGAEQREALRRHLAGLPEAGSADHADGLDRLLERLRDTKSNEKLLEAVAKGSS